MYVWESDFRTHKGKFVHNICRVFDTKLEWQECKQCGAEVRKKFIDQTGSLLDESWANHKQCANELWIESTRMRESELNDEKSPNNELCVNGLMLTPEKLLESKTNVMELNSRLAEKWLKFSANNLHQKFWSKQWKDFYEKKLGEYHGQQRELIEKDVERSCYVLRDNPRLQKQTRRELENVLFAYTVYDPELGYTQGMSFIVERLLAHLTDYQAYIVWLGVLKTDDFRSYYTNNFGDTLALNFKETKEDITLKFPKLAKHLKGICSLDVFYNLFTQISMTLGCILPIPASVKDDIITEFLQDRNKNLTVTTILFGVLHTLESTLLKLNRADDNEVHLILSIESLSKSLYGVHVLAKGKLVRERSMQTSDDSF